MIKVSLSFRNQMLLTTIAGSLVMAIVVSLLSLKTINDGFTNYIKSYRQALFNDFDAMAQKQVRQAISTLQVIHSRQTKGEISLEEAKKQAENFLREVRYDKDGYFWGYSPDGVAVVMLGKQDIEGKNRWDLQDTKGNYLIRDIVKEGMKPDGGFVEYWFPKPGDSKPLPKRSFNMYFKPFNLVVGTGNYIDDLDEMVKKAVESNRKELNSAIYRIVGLTALLLIILAVISVLSTRRMLRLIGTEPKKLEDIACRVAEGDLTVKLDSSGNGVYGAMTRMVDNLSQILNMLRQSSQSIAQAAAELNSNAERTATGSAVVVGQAATVATASEEMAATSHDIAGSCHSAAASSEQASKSAQVGAAIVRKTVDGMNRIADKVRDSALVVEQLGTRSEQIGTIVGTIEDIADQTNLLALNAAIEAARAGDQGRGFAVVADEVRALAERTTKATREIGEMIKCIQQETKMAVKAMEEGVGEVESGTTEAAKSGEALEEILRQSAGVTMQINQIATAAEEQTATTREISNNIQMICDTVQSGARSTEEITLASHQLSDLSVELENIVHRFKLVQ